MRSRVLMLRRLVTPPVAHGPGEELRCGGSALPRGRTRGRAAVVGEVRVGGQRDRRAAVGDQRLVVAQQIAGRGARRADRRVPGVVREPLRAPRGAVIVRGREPLVDERRTEAAVEEAEMDVPAGGGEARLELIRAARVTTDGRRRAPARAVVGVGELDVRLAADVGERRPGRSALESAASESRVTLRKLSPAKRSGSERKRATRTGALQAHAVGAVRGPGGVETRRRPRCRPRRR